MTKLRIFLADDHPVVRGGLKGLIDAQPDMEVVGEAWTGDDAVKAALELRPDVVVMDVSMPETGGAAARAGVVTSWPATAGSMYVSPADTDRMARTRSSAAARFSTYPRAPALSISCR